MLQKTTETFPDLFTTATHLPPQRFNKTTTEWDEVRGLHVQRESSSSDIACDRAESVVTRCLETIRKLTGEPMCVISNYPFHNYLEKKFTPLHTHRRRSDAHLHCESFPAKTLTYGRFQSPATEMDRSVERSSTASLEPDAAVTANAIITQSPCPSRPATSETDTESSDIPRCASLQNSALAWTGSDSAAGTGAAEPGPEKMEQTTSDSVEIVEMSDVSHESATNPYPGLPTPATPQSVPVLPQSVPVLLQSVPVLPQSQNSVEIPDASHDPATDPCPGLPSPTQSTRVPVLPQSQNPFPVKRDPRKQFPKPQSVFPSPADLGKDLKRGDFDFLILSQRHGCIVMETKAVGYADEADVAAVRKKVDLAVKQLSKAETVLRHMFRDLIEALPVRKVLAMPNVGREDLMAACDDGEGLEKVCFMCLAIFMLS